MISPINNVNTESRCPYLLRRFANSKFMNNHVTKYTAAKTGAYVVGIGLASIVTKDVLGCYYYVTQTLKNDRIPEAKRKFLAALDLANGVLMVATQVFMTLAFLKLQEKYFTKYFNKYFDATVIKKIADKIPLNIKRDRTSERVTEKIIKNIEDTKNTCFEGFKVISSLVIASILAKRVVVPFISTPLASWVKEKFLEKGKKSDSCNNQPSNFQVPYAQRLYPYFQNNKNLEKLYKTMNVQ